MKVFLIGMPASGKSTIATELSTIFSYKKIDMDEEIVKRERKSIEEIFTQEGEPYFRKIERQLLHRLSSEDDLVISTGGGAACFFDNMKQMNQSGITVFLNVSMEELASRIFTQKAQERPMFKGKTYQEVLELLKHKFSERKTYYEKAQIIIPGEGINASAIAQKIKVFFTF